jgi:hypothetical protein
LANPLVIAALPGKIILISLVSAALLAAATLTCVLADASTLADTTALSAVLVLTLTALSLILQAARALLAALIFLIVHFGFLFGSPPTETTCPRLRRSETSSFRQKPKSPAAGPPGFRE